MGCDGALDWEDGDDGNVVSEWMVDPVELHANEMRIGARINTTMGWGERAFRSTLLNLVRCHSDRDRTGVGPTLSLSEGDGSPRQRYCDRQGIQFIGQR